MTDQLHKISTLSPPADHAPAGPLAAGNLSWSRVWAVILILSALTTVTTQLAGGRPASGILPLTATFLMCLLAAWYDAAYGRIPNQITYTGVLLGLAIHGTSSLLQSLHLDAAAAWIGSNGIADASLGFAACLAIALICIALPKGFSGMGMGDLKLLSALGMLLGWQRLPNVLLCTLFAACIYGIINLMIAGRINTFVRSIGLQIISLIYLKRLSETYIIPPRKLPLGIPLFLGVLLSPLVPLQHWLF